jgi:hypothetical protein
MTWLKLIWLAVFGCRHDEMIRTRTKSGELWVRCSWCGYATPLIVTTMQDGRKP